MSDGRVVRATAPPPARPEPARPAQARPEPARPARIRQARIRPRPLPELLLAAAAVAAPALPLPWAPLLVVAALGTWLILHPLRREQWVLALAGALAVAALLWPLWQRAAGGSDDDWWRRAGVEYGRLWGHLGTTASEVARQLGTPPRSGLEAWQRAAFGPLAAAATAAGARGEQTAIPGLFLVDPDGRVQAWGGDGLRHELESGSLPRRGASLRVSFEAASLLWVEPLSVDRRPWRVVAGVSYSLDGLAFAPGAPAGIRWVPVTAAAGEAPADVAELVAEGGPVGPLPQLWVRVGPARPASERSGRRLAWLLLGAGVLAIVALRSASLALLAGTVLQGAERRVGVGILAGVGGCSLALGAGAAPHLVAALAVGAAGAAVGAVRPRVVRIGGVWLRGLFAGGLVLLGTWAAARLAGPLQLDEGFGGTADVVVLRLALAGFCWGLLRLAGGQRPRGRDSAAARDGWAWLAVALFLAAGAVPDRLLPAAVLTVAGCVLTARWLAELPPRGGLLARGLLVLLAVLAASAAWGGWSRVTAREQLVASRAAFAPPDAAPREDLIQGLREGFLGRDLAELGPEAGERERHDLALALWRRSPLARRDARSALVIEPFDGAPVSFSFGVPLLDGRADLDVVRWPDVVAAGWEEAVVGGEAMLGRQGEPWGRLRFWLVPGPGFGLAGGPPAAPGSSLLRDEPGRGGIEEAPVGIAVAVFAPDGRPLATPWAQTSELPASLHAAVTRRATTAGDGGSTSAAGEQQVVASATVDAPLSNSGPVGSSPQAADTSPLAVDTPAGRAWAVFAHRPAAVFVALLPWRSPAEALERFGTQVTATLLALAVALLVALPLALGRPPVRDALRRAVRSYPRRLLLVTVAIAILPLLLVNALVLQDAESRLERQRRSAGEAALGAAQRVLGEYLASLEPGYGLDTALDVRLLGWLSDVVHHEVNVYWGSRLYRSSRQELFATGLLPRRIPGEVWSQLELEGGVRVVRENHLREGSGPTWVELYAPLRLPGGVADAGDRLVLSLPSLAQQEGVAAELARERRRILLATAAALLLLLAVSVRLARSFGRPVSELVEGTRRIAAGAGSLGLGPEATAPREPELAELVGAVDEMARRIAGAREGLLREKQVVERVVETITAGVVSLDGAGRVLMHNRVAAELLGVEVGELLMARLAATPRLGPLASFVRERLRDAEGLPGGGSGGGSPGGSGGGSRGGSGGGSGGESGSVPTPRQVALRLPPVGGVGPRPTEPGPRGAATPAEGNLATAGVGEDREWTVTWVPVPGSGSPAALLVVEDATEVLRGQRLTAWAEMARIIAHEVKNPLTPIRLSAEHLREVWRRDPQAVGKVLDRCVDNILRHVEELRELASEFAVYSRISQLERLPTDLEALVAEVVSGYQTAPPPGVEIHLDGGSERLLGAFDRRLVTRAVRNLVENAVRASLGGGEVVVTLGRRGPWAEVRVGDRGPGVPSELLRRIFEPYFSTHAGGTGLGLAITQRIATAHGGDVVARNREGGGLEVVMSLALDAEPAERSLP